MHLCDFFEFDFMKKVGGGVLLQMYLHALTITWRAKLTVQSHKIREDFFMETFALKRGGQLMREERDVPVMI